MNIFGKQTRPAANVDPNPMIQTTAVQRFDVPAMVIIEEQAQGNGPAWVEHDIVEAMRGRGIGFVATIPTLLHGPRVVGFLLAVERRRSIEIVRLAVDPEFRRIGAGTALLRAIGSIAGLSHRIERLTIQVPEDLLETVCPWLARRWFMASHCSADFASIIMERGVR